MSSTTGLRAWAEVDLGALANNIALLKNRYAGAEIMAIVKADAYGHGIDLIAPNAYAGGIRHFGVATTDEGVYLRRLLLNDAIIYVLSPVIPADAPAIVADRLIPVISSVEMAQALSEAGVSQGRTADFHLDVDTGMGRSGFTLGEVHAELARMDALPNLRLTGVFTHFASADEDPDDARDQHKLFLDLLTSLGPRAEGLSVHASNSPASLVLGKPGYHTLLRPGLLLYGIEPAPGMFETFNDEEAPSQTEIGGSGDYIPVLSIRASVTLCRPLPPGSTISYGKTYTVPATGGRYATLAIGYGDGYQRAFGNVGYVLIHGRRAPIRGRVCMDQMVVEVTDIPDVKAGDVATIIGRDGAAAITVGEAADLIKTTPHLISTCLLPRLPRLPLHG
jgi:alanine racemase